MFAQDVKAATLKEMLVGLDYDDPMLPTYTQGFKDSIDEVYEDGMSTEDLLDALEAVWGAPPSPSVPSASFTEDELFAFAQADMAKKLKERVF